MARRRLLACTSIVRHCPLVRVAENEKRLSISSTGLPLLTSRFQRCPPGSRAVAKARKLTAQYHPGLSVAGLSLQGSVRGRRYPPRKRVCWFLAASLAVQPTRVNSWSLLLSMWISSLNRGRHTLTAPGAVVRSGATDRNPAFFLH